MNLLQDKSFYVDNSVTYPPFKNGLYMEEYFLKFMTDNNLQHDKNGRLYIPILWTNFQIEGWFNGEKNKMQNILNDWISKNSCENGYFTVVQYDDGPLLQLPQNTIVYGACSGTTPIPLIYEDNTNSLVSIRINNNLTFNNKPILCSFVGTITHNVRARCIDALQHSSNFKFIVNNNWTSNVNSDLQHNFINSTIQSKFALAPRGYGRSSFRFFEIFQLGSIPVYIWDDIEWLPFKDIIDYSKICVSININEISNLENKLLNIDENAYNNLWSEYYNVKYLFELNGMCKYICE